MPTSSNPDNSTPFSYDAAYGVHFTLSKDDPDFAEVGETCGTACAVAYDDDPVATATIIAEWLVTVASVVVPASIYIGTHLGAREVHFAIVDATGSNVWMEMVGSDGKRHCVPTLTTSDPAVIASAIKVAPTIH